MFDTFVFEAIARIQEDNRRYKEHAEKSLALDLRKFELDRREAEMNFQFSQKYAELHAESLTPPHQEIQETAAARMQEHCDAKQMDAPFKQNCQNQATQQRRDFARHPGESALPPPDVYNMAPDVFIPPGMEMRSFSSVRELVEYTAGAATVAKFDAMLQFNGLTAAEAERLFLMMEECGEVVQIIGKILRHGYESYNPFDEAQEPNRSLLTKELGHILAAGRLMEGAGDIVGSDVDLMRDAKLKTVGKYLHHQ